MVAFHDSSSSPSPQITITITIARSPWCGVVCRLLTGTKIHTEADALHALDRLHARGVPHVILTSMPAADDPHTLILYGSSMSGVGVGNGVVHGVHDNDNNNTNDNNNNHHPGKRLDRFRIRLPKLEGKFTGTGDLFASLIVARSPRVRSEGEGDQKGDGDKADTTTTTTTTDPRWLRDACEQAIATMQAVLQRTLRQQQQVLRQQQQQQSPEDGLSAPAALRMRSMELRIVQSKRDIEQPPMDVGLRAETI